MIKRVISKSLFVLSILSFSSFSLGCSAKETFHKLELTSASLGIWLWDATNINRINIEDKIANLGINEVYVNTGWEPEADEFYLKNHRLLYAMFAKELDKRDIKVQGLLSNDDWAKNSEYNNFKKEVKYILDFNKNFKYNFDAVHLDIEPHKLKDWEGNEIKYLKSYISNLKHIKKEIDIHNEKNKDDLRLVIDIPFWYANEEFCINGENVIDLLFDIVDEIILMTYTQNQKLFVECSLPALNIANKYKDKGIKIAMEFQENEKDITLYNMRVDDLLDYVNKSLEEFKEYDSFKGLAIHKYKSYISYIYKEIQSE
ncbi:MAG: hypothetical protein GX963_02560 [Bacteroidales bacterium]|nr:hypothetical protein [Bacteroidales bacterium]